MKTAIAATLGVCAALTGATAAQAAEKVFEASAFDSIVARNGVKLVVEVGPETSLRMEGPVDDLDDLRITQSGMELTIEPRAQLFGLNDIDVTVYATTPGLRSISGANGMIAEVTGVDSERFTVEAFRGAIVDVEGRCGSLEAEAGMGGILRAGKLVCETVDIEAGMGGTAVVHALNRFEGEASMGGVVRSCGQPESRLAGASMGGVIGSADGDDCAPAPAES